MVKRNSVSIGFCVVLYAQLVIGMQSSVELVEIQKVNPRIRVDLKYATDKNFTGKVIYKSANGQPVKCLLRKEVAQALSKVQEELEQKGFGLEVWDAYRPMSAQQKFWDLLADQYPDEKERSKYVSNPANGGRHPRATTVDLKMVRLDGKKLKKPTKFDCFDAEAACDYEGLKLSAEAREHRQMLIAVMKKHGFEVLDSEWWHFDYKGWRECPPLDVQI